MAMVVELATAVANAASVAFADEAAAEDVVVVVAQ
jgi:hypothetical protein